MEDSVDEPGEQSLLEIVAAERPDEGFRIGSVDDELVEGVERKTPLPALQNPKAFSLQGVLHHPFREVPYVTYMLVDREERRGGHGHDEMAQPTKLQIAERRAVVGQVLKYLGADDDVISAAERLGADVDAREVDERKEPLVLLDHGGRDIDARQVTTWKPPSDIDQQVGLGTSNLDQAVEGKPSK